MTQKKPIINCHTHIFTRLHVPPYIARTFVFWPFYYLIHTHAITWLIKACLKFIEGQIYKPNSLRNRFLHFIHFLNRAALTRALMNLTAAWLSVKALLILICWMSALAPLGEKIGKVVKTAIEVVETVPTLDSFGFYPDLVIVLIVMIIIPNSRKLIWSLLNMLWRFLRFVPGKQFFHLAGRYLMLGRFALRKTQARVFSSLRRQYPPDTKFVVLPMDMKYMGAGPVPSKARYRVQMNELIEIKKGSQGKFMEPFVFIDPRRIRDQTTFLKYTHSDGSVDLERCEVKRYIEDNNFSGFKIYPALGYYPFDEDLLPLWKYAADRQIPIMTHAISGTIFYRGKKKKEWNFHPIFKESDGHGGHRPLALKQRKNVDFSVNFGHPLNFLCLVYEPLLRIVVSKSKKEIRQLFGYTNCQTKLKYNLEHLKICLAHYGGEPEWVKYLEKDRDQYAQRLITHRKRGLDFSLFNDNGDFRWTVFERYWKHTDWYSLISSIIVQYDNVYSDISYILSKPRIMPLLKESLNPRLNPHLSKRILFGTDFYVVRNHFSEKDLLAQLSAGLTRVEFDRIARNNPESYLK